MEAARWTMGSTLRGAAQWTTHEGQFQGVHPLSGPWARSRLSFEAAQRSNCTHCVSCPRYHFLSQLWQFIFRHPDLMGERVLNFNVGVLGMCQGSSGGWAELGGVVSMMSVHWFFPSVSPLHPQRTASPQCCACWMCSLCGGMVRVGGHKHTQTC